jgi:hypothetical protein
MLQIRSKLIIMICHEVKKYVFYKCSLKLLETLVPIDTATCVKSLVSRIITRTLNINIDYTKKKINPTLWSWWLDYSKLQIFLSLQRGTIHSDVLSSYQNSLYIFMFRDIFSDDATKEDILFVNKWKFNLHIFIWNTTFSNRPMNPSCPILPNVIQTWFFIPVMICGVGL